MLQLPPLSASYLAGLSDADRRYAVVVDKMLRQLLPLLQFPSYATPEGVDADIAAHVAEADPHTQYLLETAAALLYQPLNARLTDISTNLSAASGTVEKTGANTFGTYTVTAAGKALIDDADASAQRTTLGLGTIATQDANNVTITGGSVTGITDLVVADGGTGVSTLTGLVKGNGTSPFSAAVAGTDYMTPAGVSAAYQPLDSDLTAIALLTTTSFGRALLELANAAALRTAAGLGTIATQNANAVAITGGSVTGITDLVVADGGTGVSTLTGLVKGNGTSAFSAAVQGTDYYAPGGTDVAVADGGTGSSTQSGARSNLGAAASGANSDITSLSALSTPLSVAQGGIGVATITGLMKGNGTGAVTAAAQGTDYYAPSGTDVALADGGTGGSTAIAAMDNLFTQSSNIASASTTDLSSATGVYATITGTVTITAFGTENAGVLRILRFSGALTLTHNSTSLILPGAANITTTAGDAAIFVSEGSGNWRCISYQTSPLPVSLGGTGGATQSAARTGLGLVIGTNVQAWDADLDTWATKTAPSGTVIGTTDSQTLTNKTIVASSNTISALATSMFAANVIDTDTTLAANSDTRLATQKATKAYVDASFAANDAMIYKGATDCSGNPNYPAANAGEMYRVSVAGKIGGASGVAVEAGDFYICNTDGTSAGNQATVGANWNVIQTNVVGVYYAGGTDVAVTDGGTGVSTLTGIVKGNGTSAFSAAVQGTDYYAPGGTDVAVADGGTGASTASGARTNLGLGTIAVQDANNVTITGGSVTGIADLAVADGGTGASTAAGARINLGLVIGTDVQAYDADLTAYATVTPSAYSLTLFDNAAASDWRTDLGLGSLATASSVTAAQISDASANGRSLISAADYSAMRTLLSLVVGTNVQAYDAELAALAGLTSAADKLPYWTGSGTAANADFSAYGRTLVDDADAATARTTLGLVIGTNVQAYDAELAALAGLTSAADKLPYFTGSGTAALATFTAAGRALVDDADAAAQRTTLGLGTMAVETAANYVSKTATAAQSMVSALSSTVTGAANNWTLKGDAGTSISIQRHSTDASESAINLGKARNTVASPNAIVAGDVLGSYRGQGYDGVSAYRSGAEMRVVSKETTPSATAMGAYIDFRTAAIGSITLTERVRLDDNGVSMGGANIVIDQNRLFRLRGYTVATLPAAGVAGRRAYVTNALAPAYNAAVVGGGAVVVPVFDNGAAWVTA